MRSIKLMKRMCMFKHLQIRLDSSYQWMSNNKLRNSDWKSFFFFFKITRIHTKIKCNFTVGTKKIFTWKMYSGDWCGALWIFNFLKFSTHIGNIRSNFYSIFFFSIDLPSVVNKANIINQPTSCNDTFKETNYRPLWMKWNHKMCVCMIKQK